MEINRNANKEISNVFIGFYHLEDDGKDKIYDYLLNKGFNKKLGMLDSYMESENIMLTIKEDSSILEIEAWHKDFYKDYSRLKDDFIIQDISYEGIKLGAKADDYFGYVNNKGNSNFYIYKSDDDTIYKIEEKIFFTDYEECVKNIDKIYLDLKNQGMKKTNSDSMPKNMSKLYFPRANPIEYTIKVEENEGNWIVMVKLNYEDFVLNDEIAGFIDDGEVFHAFGFALGEELLTENKENLSRTCKSVIKNLPNAKFKLTGNILSRIDCYSKTKNSENEFLYLRKVFENLGFPKKIIGFQNLEYKKDNILITLRMVQMTCELFVIVELIE